jgi:diguanylate cyclase (GGDEF)-like protein
VPEEPFLAILLAAVAINLLLVLGVGLATMRAERRAGETADAAQTLPSPTDRAGILLGPDGALGSTYDRVVRVVAWAVILSVTMIVVISGLWPATQTSILALMAIAGLFFLTVHDILPPSLLGEARPVVEGSVGITVATLLVVLTGGPLSPFFFVYVLITAGAALVLAPRMAVVVTAGALGGYLVGVLADSTLLPLQVVEQVVVVVNIAALVLLTYLALVIAREQRHSRDAAITLSTIDSLTGLYNRAYFFAAIERELQRSARSRRGFCLLMLDLDGLKPINDGYGHFEGDRVLRGVGEVIRRTVRRIDTAARYGGDEFVVLLPETDPTGAYILAEKIRIGAAELAIETGGRLIRTSLSIGAVAFPADGQTADDLMIAADQAMYTSKRRGKNRIVGYGARGAAARGVTASRPRSVSPGSATRRERRPESVGTMGSDRRSV